LGISFGSINTGLPKDIVKQIVAAEKIPLQKMEARKEKIKNKKKLVQELIDMMKNVKTNLNNNASARSLRELKVDTNSDLVDVAFDKNKVNPGNYRFEVVRLAQKSSAVSSGFSSKDDTYTGVGFIQYFMPNGDSREIYIDENNATLQGIANLINKDADNGLNATVIDDGSGSETPWRLLLSLNGTGDNERAEFPYFYFVDGEEDFYIDEERPAQDAIVKIDGFEVEVPGNKVDELIPGVTLDLKKAQPGEEFSINIADDGEAVSAKITDFVDIVNEVLKFINEQNRLDENSDTASTLGGDLLLQNLESRIRSVVFKDIKTNSGFKRIGDLGIVFNRSGLLEVDQQKFDSVVAKSYSLVSEILVGTTLADGTYSKGLIGNFSDVVDGALRYPNGILTTRSKGIQSNIDQIDRRIQQRQRLIDQKERTLKDKFARLESTISRIKGQGAGIAALGAGAGAGPQIPQLG
jgi:flagellar hook-associated protein 2